MEGFTSLGHPAICPFVSPLSSLGGPCCSYCSLKICLQKLSKSSRIPVPSLRPWITSLVFSLQSPEKRCVQSPLPNQIAATKALYLNKLLQPSHLNCRKCIIVRLQIKFPRPSSKGWLHILLFLAFFTIMLTSLTWIMWSQLSTSRTAQSERESKKITYAYAMNGGFIVIALIGLYLDSFRQCRTYYKRWSLLNQELRIFPYDAGDDLDYCHKGAGQISLAQDEILNTIPAFHAGEASNSTNESEITELPHRTNQFSCQNDGFAHDVEMLDDPIVSENLNNSPSFREMDQRHQWPVMVSSYIVPTRTVAEQSSLHLSMSASADLRSVLVLKETYV